MVATTLEWSGQEESVLVAGDFSDWQQRPAVKEGDKWSYKVDLQPGRYAFKWIVNGNWITDESKVTETDESGNQNNILVVEQQTVDQKTSEVEGSRSLPGSDISGDSDSWEQVSVGDCDSKSEKALKSASSEEAFEESDLPRIDIKKVDIQRSFSPSEEYFEKISTVGEKLESSEYPVFYWDTPYYTLMKEGVWLKQLKDEWLLRKLDDKGVSTILDKSSIEHILADILEKQESFEGYLREYLTHRIEFEGSNTRWGFNGLELQHLKEGDLHTINIKLEDTLGDGLRKIYDTATSLHLKTFKLV